MDARTHYYTWAGKQLSTVFYYKVWGIYKEGIFTMEWSGTTQLANLYIDFLNKGNTPGDWDYLITKSGGKVKKIRSLIDA